VKVKVLSIVLLFMILFAGYLGMFAQDIAYDLADLFDETPFKMLNIVTITSIGLFILIFVIQLILFTRKKIKPKLFVRMLMATVSIGGLVSLWSLFILIMWWG